MAKTDEPKQQAAPRQEHGRLSRIERYQRMMADIKAENLMRGRSEMVRRFRKNPDFFPHGIGSWYNPDDWNDRGELIKKPAYAESKDKPL